MPCRLRRRRALRRERARLMSVALNNLWASGLPVTRKARREIRRGLR